MAGMRAAIEAGSFEDFYASTMAGWAGGDIPAL
jgi:queuine tRNA-ribosyltransferase